MSSSLGSSVYIHIYVITKLQLQCFMQGKYCWWEICLFISFKILYLLTTFPKCLNYRTEIFYEGLCEYKKINLQATYVPQSCNWKTLIYTIYSFLKSRSWGHHIIARDIFLIDSLVSLLSIHFYYVSSHSMGLLSLVYPVVLFFHCMFHRVKLTPLAELYKFLLLSMFTHAKRFNFIPFASH